MTDLRVDNRRQSRNPRPNRTRWTVNASGRARSAQRRTRSGGERRVCIVPYRSGCGPGFCVLRNYIARRDHPAPDAIKWAIAFPQLDEDPRVRERKIERERTRRPRQKRASCKERLPISFTGAFPRCLCRSVPPFPATRNARRYARPLFLTGVKPVRFAPHVHRLSRARSFLSARLSARSLPLYFPALERCAIDTRNTSNVSFWQMQTR